MNGDTMARVRRVVDGLNAERAMLAAGPSERELDGEVLEVLLSHYNAAPALLAIVEAVGRLADERRKRGSDPWYLQFGWNDDAYMPCIGCELMNLDARTGDHAPGCPALAIDAAFAQLAALASDETAP